MLCAPQINRPLMEDCPTLGSSLHPPPCDPFYKIPLWVFLPNDLSPRRAAAMRRCLWPATQDQVGKEGVTWHCGALQGRSGNVESELPVFQLCAFPEDASYVS